MSSVPTEAELEVIEKMIDRYSLFEVLMAIACICGDKADHIRVNWQDKKTARTWNTAHNRIVALCRSIEI